MQISGQHFQILRPTRENFLHCCRFSSIVSGVLFFIACLILVAALHDQIPGLCLHLNSHAGIDDCPLCHVKYHVFKSATLWLILVLPFFVFRFIATLRINGWPLRLAHTHPAFRAPPSA
ncbi:MAG TPA: hypothetical protein PLX03_06305 [Candidatus Hydrogenedentes bacterium]|nr:hypothetical protein [Candidatus Hydrogenedentota bacterium]